MHWLGIPETHRARRLALVAATILLYALLYALLSEGRGSAAGVLGILPAIAAGWALGLRGGLLVAFLTQLIAFAILAARGDSPWWVGTVVILGLAGAAGWAGDTNRALKAEREKTNALLHSILPHQVAERLKEEPQVIADSYDDVTILFADIVDFSTLSRALSPRQLINLLNELFSLFDQLAEQHGVEKIKTIGDTYMAAGGVPTPNPRHAEAIADMALDMLREIETFNTARGTSLKLRVGIATGRVVAGVIGTSKYYYDLWGNTVNTASRMESHGVPGRIQVTTESFEKLRRGYHLVKRGKVEVKGKGVMTTYFLLGKRDEVLERGTKARGA